MELALFHLVAYVAVGVLSEALSDALSPQYCTILSVRVCFLSSFNSLISEFLAQS